MFSTSESMSPPLPWAPLSPLNLPRTATKLFWAHDVTWWPVLGLAGSQPLFSSTSFFSLGMVGEGWGHIGTLVSLFSAFILCWFLFVCFFVLP